MDLGPDSVAQIVDVLTTKKSSRKDFFATWSHFYSKGPSFWTIISLEFQKLETSKEVQRQRTRSSQQLERERWTLAVTKYQI